MPAPETPAPSPTTEGRLRSIRALIVPALALAALSCWAGLGGAAEGGEQLRERYWIMRELRIPPAPGCAGEVDCGPRSRYEMRPFPGPDAALAASLFKAVEARLVAFGELPEPAEAPRLCPSAAEKAGLPLDPELLRLSGKLDPLRGLPGLHVDVTRLKAPDGYEGAFGPSLQQEFEARFRAAGIHLYSAEEILHVPGRPILKVFFTPTRPNGCHYSIFATLTQTVLLTRDLSIKLEAGTWARLEGPRDEFPEATEYDAIIRVAEAFVRDYLAANGKNAER